MQHAAVESAELKPVSTLIQQRWASTFIRTSVVTGIASG